MAFIHKSTKIFLVIQCTYTGLEDIIKLLSQKCRESNELPVIILCLLCIDSRFPRVGHI